MTVKLANQINGDFNIFKCKIKNLLLYEKSNMTTLKEIFEARNKIHYEFQKQGSPPFSSNSMRIQGNIRHMKVPMYRSNRQCLWMSPLRTTRTLWHYRKHFGRLWFRGRPVGIGSICGARSAST